MHYNFPEMFNYNSLFFVEVLLFMVLVTCGQHIITRAWVSIVQEDILRERPHSHNFDFILLL